MFPPNLVGTTTVLGFVSGGATPIVPIMGTLGKTRPGSSSTSPAEIEETRKWAEGKSSASSPKPGMFAVQPQVSTSMATTSTTRTSPGSAPSIAMGPVTGLTLAKSSAATSGFVECLASWPPDEFATSTVTSSPGETRATGGMARSHMVWVVDRVRCMHDLRLTWSRTTMGGEQFDDGGPIVSFWL